MEIEIISSKKTSLTNPFLFAFLFTCVLCFTMIFTTAVYADRNLYPEDGYYKIVATEGNGKNKALYYDTKATSRFLKWKNQDDATVWKITREEVEWRIYTSGIRSTSGYKISLADQPSYHIACKSLNTDEDMNLYVTDDKGGSCPFQWMLFFDDETGSSDDFYINVLDVQSDGYNDRIRTFVRDRALGYDYVKIVKNSHLYSKLWKLVKVNYNKSMSKTAPSCLIGKNGILTLNWKTFLNKMKNSNVWKNADYLEIQCAADPDFSKNLKTKKISTKTLKIESLGEKNLKTRLLYLKKGKTYYIRVRLIDNKGVYSNWSKVIKTK